MSCFKTSKQASDISSCCLKTTRQKSSSQDIACVEGSKRGGEGRERKKKVQGKGREGPWPKPFPISLSSLPGLQQQQVIAINTL